MEPGPFRVCIEPEVWTSREGDAVPGGGKVPVSTEYAVGTPFIFQGEFLRERQNAHSVGRESPGKER